MGIFSDMLQYNQRQELAGQAQQQNAMPLVLQEAMRQRDQQEQAQGLSDVLSASGMNPRGIPGIGGALAGPQGADVANQLMANPAVSPNAQALQEQQQMAANQAAEDRSFELMQRQQEMANAQQAALQGAQDAFIGKAKPLRDMGRDMGNIDDMRTLLANEGKILAPGKASGIYTSLRGQLLNSLRKQFEAGALQAAELEFFETLLPDAGMWGQLSQNERMAMLNEMKFQYGTRLDDELMFSNTGLTREQVIRPGRAFNDMIDQPLPDGFSEMMPAPEVPTGPSGTLSPFSGFFQQMGF